MPILNEQTRNEMINFLKRNLDIPNGGVWAHYYEDGYEDEDWYEDFRYDCGADYIEHGASKIVLFYENFPQWVFKIPFAGEYIEDENSYKDFKNSNLYFPIAANNDYCAGEVYISQQARYYGLEEMFAITYFLFEIAGTPIYVSEKVPNSRWSYRNWRNKGFSFRVADDVSKCRRNALCESCLDREVIAYFADAYGEEKVYNLIDFIIEYCIKDLHNGNVGFTRDMKIKILDYSGFDS